ncbi:MAG: hypothetical protein EA342_16250 [Leptolyngbya sp. LCM1.Bin17]|nr:MAG: hypothetical protein EA342_16250 [Leptolyngbya sp. LCM1.Bin17]
MADYDAAFQLNGTKTAILTDSRVIYHQPMGTSVIPLTEVERIEHETDGMVGDSIRINRTGLFQVSDRVSGAS